VSLSKEAVSKEFRNFEMGAGQSAAPLVMQRRNPNACHDLHEEE
jgi:hypothetical protein